MNGDHHHHHHHHHQHLHQRNDPTANNPNSLHLQFFQVTQDPIPTSALDTSSLVVNRVTMNPLVEATAPPSAPPPRQQQQQQAAQTTTTADPKGFETEDEDDKYSEDKLDPIAFAIRNRKFKSELTPDERGYIIGRSVSTSLQELSKELKMSRSTIQHTLKMCRQRKHNKTRNQNRGRRLAISPEEMEEVLKLIESKPSISKQEVISVLNLKVSPRTLTRALQRSGNKKGTQRK
ncbi:hypothetical protein Cantr_07701 [Candida viswanathii]|uniref:Uncharacterized protein n=1 Tax=Candida viswanathii TaxID=5486 RepID=A0A367XZ33_9ASCO|nr:hypothetical protein Cantr_07701 [Candida viswanathii]